LPWYHQEGVAGQIRAIEETLMFSEMTRKCAACGRIRPTAKITVYETRLDAGGGYPDEMVALPYCNDCDACFQNVINQVAEQRERRSKL